MTHSGVRQDVSDSMRMSASRPVGRRTALLSGLLFAVRPGAWCPSATAATSDVWRRGEAMEPSSFDPHKVSTVVEGRVLDELYEGLTVYDGDGRLQPGVAERWDVGVDQLTYTFHLRHDARWSNGDPVTADDFAYAFRRLMDPKTGAQYASILYTVKNARGVNTGGLPIAALGVHAPNPQTFVIELEHPAAYLLAQLTHFTAMPLHRAEVDRWGAAFARPGRMVGNGAFVLTRYVPNERIVMTKNPFFRDAAQVALQEEIFLPTEDASAGLRRFLAGETESFSTVPADEIGFVHARIEQEFKVAPSLGSYFYAFDCRHKPFDDSRVRQALAMVIDRDFLAGTIWGGTMLPGFSFVPPGIASYGAPSTVTWKNESSFTREDEARRLLAAAGYGPAHPLRITLRYNQSENHKATAIAVADMWKVLGVKTTFIVTDANTHYAFLESGQPFDVVRSGWFADFPDAQNYLFLAESDNKGLNYAHFSNPAYDTLMRQAEVETDQDVRREILHQAESLLLAEQPYLVLMTYQSTNLVSPKLQGWSANILDHHPGRYVSIRP